MPEFRNREEYEEWKAQRLKELQEKKLPGDVPRTGFLPERYPSAWSIQQGSTIPSLR
jgi:hypothetical protein